MIREEMYNNIVDKYISVIVKKVAEVLMSDIESNHIQYIVDKVIRLSGTTKDSEEIGKEVKEYFNYKLDYLRQDIDDMLFTSGISIKELVKRVKLEDTYKGKIEEDYKQIKDLIFIKYLDNQLEKIIDTIYVETICFLRSKYER